MDGLCNEGPNQAVRLYAGNSIYGSRNQNRPVYNGPGLVFLKLNCRFWYLSSIIFSIALNNMSSVHDVNEVQDNLQFRPNSCNTETNKAQRTLEVLKTPTRQFPRSNRTTSHNLTIPRWVRRQSFAPSGRSYYHAIYVYKHTNTNVVVDNGPYDIEVYTNNKPISASKTNGKELVLERNIVSTRNLFIVQFTKFMRWKMRYFQIKDINVEAFIQPGKMSYIDAPLDWIESVIDVEIDYHLGDKNCMRPENDKYLKQYIESQWSGYGEKFYSEGPSIMDSRFYNMFTNLLG